ncbi:thiol reductant ABC exporter subunit CydD [Salsuginibacillus kocurii]|uniref:thiol reductant ABC exporter subunit CydD n=1 Tax=Salsuginibacillus kocurii TaxID=427078 RepID=UPI00036E7244|nr:thiol reductant ABC exporter subunit CydD [Salsuginibacillus kocurii]
MDPLRPQAFAQKRRMFFLILFTILLGTALILQAYFLVKIVDEAFLQAASFEELTPLFAGLAAAFFLRVLLNVGSGRLGTSMAQHVKKTYHKQLLSHFAKQSRLQADKGQTGEKASLLLDAGDELDPYFHDYIPKLLQAGIIPVLLLLAVFSQNLYSGLILLITAPFIPIAMAVVGTKTKKKSDEKLKELSAFSGRFLDTLQGLLTLKVYGRAHEQTALIRSSSLNFSHATMDVLKVAFLSTLILELISMLGMGILAIEVGLRLAIFDQLSFFTAFFVLILAPEFYNALKNYGTAFHTSRTSLAAAEKIEEELAGNEQGPSWGARALSSQDMPPALTFRNAGLSLNEEEPLLKHINAEIAPKSNVAVVGRSGAGKSLLLDLAAGLVEPTAGELLVNEQPLSDYSESDWFQHISYLSQHPVLFSGTIAANIALGATAEASRAQIEEAAEQAGLFPLVEELEDGLDTVIGEGGRGLSGGEKQRIALARVFLKRPAIILFDEPTVGLDVRTERLLQTAITNLSREATLITAAHRLHTINQADQILVLKNGELEATGSHEELKQTSSEYRQLVHHQKGGA